MIDQIFLDYRICDLCIKDESKLQPRLIGIMENHQWVGGPTKENVSKAQAIRLQWEKEITKSCVVIRADMDEIVICEEHLAEVLAKKENLISELPI